MVERSTVKLARPYLSKLGVRDRVGVVVLAYKSRVRGQRHRNRRPASADECLAGAVGQQVQPADARRGLLPALRAGRPAALPHELSLAPLARRQEILDIRTGGRRNAPRWIISGGAVGHERLASTGVLEVLAHLLARGYRWSSLGHAARCCVIDEPSSRSG